MSEDFVAKQQEQLMENKIKKSIEMFETQQKFEEYSNECARKHVTWLLETSKKYGMEIDSVSRLFTNAMKSKPILLTG